MSGTLDSLTIIELGGIGPAPFCGMMLADHGAEVILVHRPGAAPDPRDPLNRGRTLVEADLKTPEGAARIRDLARSADGLIEGFRPGVMERLGLGPEGLLGDNPKLVYGRMTGWGQDGPLAQAPGHDIDYIAVSGALHAFGRAGEKPTPPINLVGDFGGGGMLLAFGMVAGLLKAQRTGRGDVIDCAMSEGSALLMSMIWGFRQALPAPLPASMAWRDERGVNLLDTGAPFYEVYETADGKHLAVGAIEPAFYIALLRLTGLTEDPDFAMPFDPAQWPALKDRLAAVFLTRSRDDWCAHPEAQAACVAPVLSMTEAPAHPHNRARGAFVAAQGVIQPAPAPRFRHNPPRVIGQPV